MRQEGRGSFTSTTKVRTWRRVAQFPITKGWVAQADVFIDPDDRRLVLTNLLICPPGGLQAPPESNLTVSVLRSVKTGRLLSRVYEELNAKPGQVAAWEEFLNEPVPEWRHKAEKRATSELEAGVVKRGPTGRPDSHFRRVASLYLDLQAAGWGRGILLEIQRRLKAESREQLATGCTGPRPADSSVPEPQESPVDSPDRRLTTTRQSGSLPHPRRSKPTLKGSQK